MRWIAHHFRLRVSDGFCGGFHRIANRWPAVAVPAATAVMSPEVAQTRNAPSYLFRTAI